MKNNNHYRMRSLLTALLTLCLPLSVLWANPVDKEQALEKAKKFYNGRGLASKSSKLKLMPSFIPGDGKSAVTDTEGDCFYVFTAGDDGGFVIISGDDRTVPVLGYSDSGSFRADDMPVNMKAWLEGYASLIREAQRTQRLSAPEKITTHAAVAPLLATRWNQKPPFNNQCPVFFDEEKYGKAVTGCVATAMAQIMKYNRYPAKTTTAIPGYQCSRDWSSYLGTSSPAYITVPEVPVTTFDWDNMLDTYTGSETDAQKNAVAKLMLACGASVQMNYGIEAFGGSGGDFYAVKNAFVTYFGYDKSMKFVMRNDYSASDWDNLLYTEVSNQRPVFYGGDSTGGGHDFVIDGYDGNGYFHVNWGWGGLHNGYFMIDILTPQDDSGVGAGVGGYNAAQHAIVGIKPNAGGNTATDDVLSSNEMTITGEKTFTRSSGSANFSNVSVAASFYNQTGETAKFDLGYGVFDANGNMVSVHPLRTNVELAPSRGYSVNNSNLSFSFGANLGNGKYRIVPVSKHSQDSQWQKNKGSMSAYILATISGNTLTLGDPQFQISYDITVLNTPEVYGPADIRLSFTNNGADFVGDLIIKEGALELYDGHLELKAGETLTQTVSVTLQMQGSTSVTLLVNGKPVAACSVQTTAPKAQSLACTYNVTNANAANEINDSDMKITIEYENKGQNNYDNNVMLRLWKRTYTAPNTYSGKEVTTKYDRITLAKGDKVQRSYVFNGLEDGAIYAVSMYYMSQGGYVSYGSSDAYTFRQSAPAEKSSYAVVYENTLTLYYDDQKDNRPGKKYNIKQAFSTYPGWAKDSLNIHHVRIDASYASRKPSTLRNWFSHHVNLTSIEGLEYLNTSSATSMWAMFYKCRSLQSIDLSHFDTQNVTEMQLMFCGCTSLSSLNVSSFNTQNVTSMTYMFCNCPALTSLNLSNFNTQNVKDMAYMFCECPSLTSLNVSSFNTKNVTDMSFMFYGCSSLTNLNLSSFNTAKVQNMHQMFIFCRNLAALNLSNFNTSSVTNMNRMFSDCNALAQLNISSFNTQNVTDMGCMFYDCMNLTTLDVSSFQTAKVTDMAFMFRGCSKLQMLDLSGFTTDNVEGTNIMFYNCSSLKTIYASNSWNTAKVLNSYLMFGNCNSLVGGAGTRYDENHADKEYARIDGGTSSPGYFTKKGSQRKGDVNGDGNVNSADVQKVYALMAQGATGINHPEADVNDDGNVNSADIQKIYSIMAGKNVKSEE